MKKFLGLDFGISVEVLCLERTLKKPWLVLLYWQQLLARYLEEISLQKDQEWREKAETWNLPHHDFLKYQEELFKTNTHRKNLREHSAAYICLNILIC